MSIPDRIARLRSEMVDLEVDGFLVSAPENRRYLSGFTGSNGYLLITESDAVLATDFRYIEQAEAESPSYRLHRTRGGTGWLPDMLSELGVSTLAIEADHMTVYRSQRAGNGAGGVGERIRRSDRGDVRRCRRCTGGEGRFRAGNHRESGGDSGQGNGLRRVQDRARHDRSADCVGPGDGDAKAGRGGRRRSTS